MRKSLPSDSRRKTRQEFEIRVCVFVYGLVTGAILAGGLIFFMAHSV